MAKGAPIHKLVLTGRPLRESASVLMVRWNEMLAWAENIHDPRCVAELHNLRIAAKRLRYDLEIFQPVLVSAGKTLRTVEEIQERIGKIHDCDVLFPLLEENLELEMKRERRKKVQPQVGPPPFLAAEGIVAMISRKRDERNSLYMDFINWWDALPPAKLGRSLERIIELATSSSTSLPNEDRSLPNAL